MSDYLDDIERLKYNLAETGDFTEDYEGAQQLVDYIDRLERMIEDIHRKTEFAYDYENTWRGMLAEEY